MRILMLNNEYPPLGGGGSNACKYILKEFAAKDLDVDVVTSSSSNTFETEKIGDTVNIYKLPINKKDIHYWTQREIITYSWKANKFIKKLIEEKEYDVCHAFFGIPCGAIAYLFRKKIPYIVSLRGSDVPGFNNRFGFEYVFLKPIIRSIWKRAGAVVANSKGLKELALLTSPAQEISVIYNGIDVSEFKPDLDRTNDGDMLRIVCVSRLIERKGIKYLIEAIGKLKDKNIKLVLVGEGKQEEEYMGFLEEIRNRASVEINQERLSAMRAKAPESTNTEEDFSKALKSGRPVLVDFGSNSCLPCRQLRPILQEIRKEQEGKVEVLVIDVYKYQDLAREFGIQAIPTIILFDSNAKEVFRNQGFMPKAAIMEQTRKVGVS